MAAHFGRISGAAVITGILAGLVLFAIQSLWIDGLLRQAEAIEIGLAGEAMGHEAPHWWMSLIADVLVGVGYSLLLASAMTLRAGTYRWQSGFAWGAAGFLAFALAPALGLPAALPGMPEAPLAARQAWWVLTVSSTCAGLALIAFRRQTHLLAAGAILIALPHVVGAPATPDVSSPVPENLAATFTMASLFANAALWITIGIGCAMFLGLRRS